MYGMIRFVASKHFFIFFFLLKVFNVDIIAGVPSPPLAKYANKKSRQKGTNIFKVSTVSLDCRVMSDLGFLSTRLSTMTVSIHIRRMREVSFHQEKDSEELYLLLAFSLNCLHR